MIALRPHADAVLSRLRSTGLPVGDGRQPVGSGWQGAAGQSRFVTYLVLYPLPSQRGGPDAGIGDRYRMPVTNWQVTAVGQDQRAADTAADLAAARMCNHVPLDIPNVSTVMLIHEFSEPAERDESVSPPLFYAVDRYRLDTQTQ